MSKDSIHDIVKEVVHSLGFILIECSVNYGKTKDVLKVIIHHSDKKITSDDCTSVADIISRQMDIDDPFERAYDLVVESPGVEREIKSNEEFKAFLNREFKIFLYEHASIISKEGFIISSVVDANEEGLTIKNNQEQVFVSFNDIKKAKLYCDYDQLLKKNK